MRKQILALFLSMVATVTVTANITLAADPLYQKPRLQRDFNRRQLELKLRQRQLTRPSALEPVDPVKKQRLQEYYEQRQRQQLELYEKQRQSVLPGQTDPDLKQNNQALERQQRAQDLQQNMQPPLAEDCCSLEPDALDDYDK